MMNSIIILVVVIILMILYGYSNGYIKVDSFAEEEAKIAKDSKDIKKTISSTGAPPPVEEVPASPDKYLIEGRRPPSAKYLKHVIRNEINPAECSFDNSVTVNNKYNQMEDRTADYRLARMVKRGQQNTYRADYARARKNAKKFAWIWKDELDEQERRQWMNQPAGSIRMTKFDNY